MRSAGKFGKGAALERAKVLLGTGMMASGHALASNVRGVGPVKAIVIHSRTGALMGGVSPTRDSYLMAY